MKVDFQKKKKHLFSQWILIILYNSYIDYGALWVENYVLLKQKWSQVGKKCTKLAKVMFKLIVSSPKVGPSWG